MSKDFSFDIVSEFDKQELLNAVDQTQRELSNRFDLKNTGNVALDFTCLLTTNVEIKGAEFDELPILIRLRDYKGNYLIGSKDKWECFDKASMEEHAKPDIKT